MEPIIRQIFDPDSSLLGRIVAILALGAVAIFYYMLRRSDDERSDSPRAQQEARETDRRAEAIVAQARRELAAKKAQAGE